jgi:hypothetical protein
MIPHQNLRPPKANAGLWISRQKKTIAKLLGGQFPNIPAEAVSSAVRKFFRAPKIVEPTLIRRFGIQHPAGIAIITERESLSFTLKLVVHPCVCAVPI